MHALALGLDPAFTVLDRGDAADLHRSRARRSRRSRRASGGSRARTPASRSTRARSTRARTLEAVLAEAYPWCREHAARAARAVRARTSRTSSRATCSTTTTCCCGGGTRWRRPSSPRTIRARSITCSSTSTRTPTRCRPRSSSALAPSGPRRDRGRRRRAGDLLVPRRDRPQHPRRSRARSRTPARVVPLEENYRSTVPIVAAANAVIERVAAAPREDAALEPRRRSERPTLAIVDDELAEVDYVIEQVLAYREAGLAARAIRPC